MDITQIKMSKKGTSLLELVAARTAKNVVKAKGGSGRKTYLDRFVDVLTNEAGEPTEPKDRTTIITEISCQILEEKLTEAGQLEEFALTEDGTGEFDIMLADINRKVKSQVASAVADNNNSTSISYNENYKDKWSVVKDGKMVSLAPVVADENAED